MIESEYYNSEELLPDDDDLFLLNLDSGDAPSPSPSFGGQDPQLEGGSNPDSFPTVLHDIVSDESTDDCICWLPCGTRFQITDKKKFSKNVLSIYFGSRGTTKFTSFTRRLKRWKFNRVTKGPEIGAYYHENFVRGKPELLSKIIYPGPRKAGPTAPAPSKSSPKVKSANKARRRASTGCILQPLTDPFDVAVGSITEPTDPREKWTIESDTLDISPMPVRNKLNSSKSPTLPKDFTAWLSETNFFDDDSGLTQNNEMTSPKAQASVVSLSSQLSPPPLSNSNASFNAGAGTHQPFRLASRRHSCIASIHSSSSPSYDVPLNDVSDAAKRNEGFDYTRPATTTSSHIPVTKNNDTLWMTKQPQIQQPQIQQPQQQVLLQQWQQQQQQQQQHHHHQRYEPFYQHQPQQQLLRQQQQQLLRFVSEPNDDSVPAPAPKQLEQPILAQSTTTSMPKMQKTQIHEQQQHQSQHRSSFQDETDALLRFSREFKLEDFLKDCY